MTWEEAEKLHRKIAAGFKSGAARAMEEHRRMGRSIVVWQDGKVGIVPLEEIPIMSPEHAAALEL